ncbi:pyridoxamine 5'-phosphate oxidase family protein [Pseudonocardia endophytica]|uniref:pyridoxamine 5'-phosphate oxidase family protein n=1 Tax=Pseudonocardia endophytica TaxID=401976 RepID=UPI001046AC19|nr:pyridoxamine 5'-phosphate oxidase family protein [Pseudonocardia endophytica]
MATWEEFAADEPEFAALVQRCLDRSITKIVATLRADGSPRVSGFDAVVSDGQLAFGSMPHARKGADLRRDPRFALHCAPADQSDGSLGDGDVKVSGRAVPTGDLTGETEGDGFRADITEVVWTGLNDARDRLVVRWWRPGEEVRRIERE